MLTESCIGCGVDVPLSGAVHILVNPKGDRDVTDGYLCRSCYEEHVEPLLPDETEDAEAVDESSGTEDGRTDAEDVNEGDDRRLEEA